MRILWCGGTPNMVRTSSYAKQGCLIIPELVRLGHDVALFATHGWEGAPTTMQIGGYPIPVFPRGRDTWGNDTVAAHASAWRADIVISFVDLWVLDGKQYSAASAWCPYFTQDCEPMPPNDKENLRANALQPIAYSRFGQRVAETAGIDAAYVPFILETDVFTPGDQKEARAALGWPADSFMLSMVAANRGFPSRKAIPECLKAFQRFAQKHKDAYLYLHTKKGDDGDLNIPALIEQLGLGGRVQMPRPYGYRMGFEQSYLVNVYRASNALLHPSYGEGLGMTILEAQACGTPVITGDWSGQSEICFDGYLIEKPGGFVEGYGFIEQEYMLPHLGNHFIPPIAAIVRGLEWAYQLEDTQERKGARRAACLFYGAQNVTANYWNPVLESIQERLTFPVKRHQKGRRVPA